MKEATSKMKMSLILKRWKAEGLEKTLEDVPKVYKYELEIPDEKELRKVFKNAITVGHYTETNHLLEEQSKSINICGDMGDYIIIMNCLLVDDEGKRRYLEFLKKNCEKQLRKYKF